jgi:hypothetical protein
MTTKEENMAMDALRSNLEINYKAIQPCREFQRLADKLGTKFAAPITQLQLEECLRDNAVAIYPLDRVVAFMDAKATGVPSESKYYKTSWGWHPLRTIDRDRPAGLGYMGHVYEKPVPVEVLTTVEKISDQLGPAVRFYVADLVRVKLNIDPFLCVTARGCPLYVIERWDEPAFRS